MHTHDPGIAGNGAQKAQFWRVPKKPDILSRRLLTISLAPDSPESTWGTGVDGIGIQPLRPVGSTATSDRELTYS